MLTESFIQDETMSEIRRNNGQLLSPFDSTPSIADIGDLSIEEAHIILRFDRSQSDFVQSDIQLSESPLEPEVKEWYENSQYLAVGKQNTGSSAQSVEMMIQTPPDNSELDRVEVPCIGSI